MEENYLRCQVSAGLFSGEVAVRGMTSEGVEFSLFVPDDLVECQATPSGGEAVEGWLAVEVLDAAGSLLLVRLPGQTFENGQTIVVPGSQVQRRARREKV